jgi:hypothetical protein
MCVVTEHAVEKHIRGIMQKLNIDSGPEDDRRVLAVLTFLRFAGATWLPARGQDAVAASTLSAATPRIGGHFYVLPQKAVKDAVAVHPLFDGDRFVSLEPTAASRST